MIADCFSDYNIEKKDLFLDCNFLKKIVSSAQHCHNKCNLEIRRRPLCRLCLPSTPRMKRPNKYKNLNSETSNDALFQSWKHTVDSDSAYSAYIPKRSQPLGDKSASLSVSINAWNKSEWQEETKKRANKLFHFVFGALCSKRDYNRFPLSSDVAARVRVMHSNNW